MLSNILNVSTHSCVIQLLIEQFHVNGTIIKPSASKLHCNLAFGTCCEIIIRCFKMLLQQNIHAIWIFINSRIKHGLLLVIWTIGHCPGKEKDTLMVEVKEPTEEDWRHKFDSMLHETRKSSSFKTMSTIIYLGSRLKPWTNNWRRKIERLKEEGEPLEWCRILNPAW